ncbi:hypothetical protein BCU68_15270 [Vibrio sp. 10N.286.49.B3]|uniref:TraB/GumN family protein n=1 Tax=Vibrio sp. 10N.286.49.B3 TaxID=1880855 RepID=UPI000CAFECDA|nr:TraB/GumN family protein [Vibrio sp. 10N.286.49.B3]PMH41810.1 hypothetical protein BCU68_15270 [Vibrio sp. 10N.286.49.B3]
MFKRIVTNSLVFISIIFTSFAYSDSSPMVWKAVKGDKELMLFGSVHVGHPSMYPLPSIVTQYLQQSDGLIIEADVRDTHNLKYPETTKTTQAYLTTTQLKALNKIADDLGINYSSLLSAAPWTTALSIQMKAYEDLGYRPRYGIDNYLVKQALKSDIPLLSLETLQYQINLFADFPDEGRELLTDAIEQWQSNLSDVECLMDSWKAGDIHHLATLATETQVSEWASEHFLYQRNRNWAKKLNSNTMLTSDGHYLVVVGALHLVGEHNLLQLLANEGFEIFALSSPGKANCQIKR